MKDPKPVLKDNALYFGDNGRITCGAHAGASARFTGRGISGARVRQVTPADVAAWPTYLDPIACESCGRIA